MSDQLTAQPKPPIAAGGALASLVPQSLDEYFRFSQALSRSGDMVPKHFQNNAEMIMAALIRGAEIGLLPMQALSNIAVINGRASIWGDALPAIIQRAGHHVDVEVEGEGDAMVATATLTRGDTGRVFVRTFSVADAKKANLWGKAGPWQGYPKRMLANRARTYVIRDGAADAMMGLVTDDEAAELPPIRDVTPPQSRLMQKVQAAREATPASAPEAAQEVEDAIEAPDTAETEVGNLADGFDAASAEPGSASWEEGIAAFRSGVAREDCPLCDDAASWLAGWDGAQKAAQE